MFEGLWERSRFPRSPCNWASLNLLQSKCKHQYRKSHIVKGWLRSQNTSDGGLWSEVLPAGLCSYIFWDWEVNQREVGAGAWRGVGNGSGQRQRKKHRAWMWKGKCWQCALQSKKDSWPMARLSQLQKHARVPRLILYLFCHPLIIIWLSLYTLGQESIRCLYWKRLWQLHFSTVRPQVESLIHRC